MDEKQELLLEGAFKKLMECCPTNEENFSFLIRLIQRNVVIPFLGAGFSANFGYPGWGSFIRDQAQKQNIKGIKEALDAYEYEKAASILKENLSGSMEEYTLIQIFGDHVYKSADENRDMEFLPKIFPNLLLTTNFDEVIEMLYAKVNGEYIEKLTPKSIKDAKVIHKRIACGEPTLIKLHGDVATREFVLTEEEYNEIYGEHTLDSQLPLPMFLHDILLSKVILFLGCSLEDDRTLQVIEQAQIDGSISFALLPLPSETENKKTPWEPNFFNVINGNKEEKKKYAERKRFLAAHNIVPIWYPYGKKEALKIFLKEIAFRVNSEYLSVTVAQSTLNQLLKNGDSCQEKGDVTQAYFYYADAERILKTNTVAFTQADQIKILKKMKTFYSSIGYDYERKEVIKKLISLTKEVFGYSVELSLCYHDIGYTYERYRYYKLMLKAMQRSRKALDQIINNVEIYKNGADSTADTEQCIFNTAAYIYISLGYAYLKNGNTEEAKACYTDAMKLYSDNGTSLSKKSQAFICNGLYRYYMLLNDAKTAIQTLDKAIVLRKELFENNMTTVSPKHLINSHSNKIRVYLKIGQLNMAETEYETCMEEYNMQERLNTLPACKHRILTDYGDILMNLKKYDKAYEAYMEALGSRKYLHYPYDSDTILLYQKIAKSLGQLDNRHEEALEYLIQAFVICEKIFGNNGADMKEIKDQMESLRICLSYTHDSLEQRISVQRMVLCYRYDEQIDKREDDLIQYFDL